jgi:hypothetical protein
MYKAAGVEFSISEKSARGKRRSFVEEKSVRGKVKEREPGP